MKYNEAKELIQMKTNTVKSFMIDLEQVEIALEEEITAEKVFELINTVNAVEKEAAKKYKAAVSCLRECDGYVYCENLEACENNFKLEQEMFKELEKLREALTELNQKIKEIKNKTF